MEKWKSNTLFGIAVGGTIFLLFAKRLGFDLEAWQLTGFGACLTWVLTNQTQWGSGNSKKPKHDDTEDEP